MTTGRERQEARAADVLAELVRDLGADAIGPGRLRPVLNDYLGSDAVELRREVDLLSAAADLDAAGVLRADPAAGDRQLVASLTGGGRTPDEAAWAVRSFQSALGMVPSTEPDPVPEPRPTIPPQDDTEV